MPTTNQLSTLEFSNNMLLNSLDKPDKSEAVYDFSGGYNVIDLIITSQAPARQIDGKDGVFEKPIIGRGHRVTRVLSTALTGSNLRVNFVDTTYDKFRNDEVIGDGTAAMYQGRVIAKGAGYVILEPTAQIVNVGGWNTTIHFLADSNAVALYVASANRNSDAIESLYEYPTYVRNQTSIIREGLSINRRDMSKSWATYEGDYWYSAQDMMVMKRFARALEARALYSVFGTTNGVNYSMGFRQAVQDSERGGIYEGLTSALTFDQFVRWIGRIADRQAAQKVTLRFGVGRGFLAWIQAFPNITQQIIYSGQSNTLGGVSVDGFDVYKFAINGISCEFVMIPFLNDNEFHATQSSIGSLQGRPRASYTCFSLDDSQYESVGGSLLPAMEKVYFGDEEVIYGYIPGMIGNGQGGNSTVFRNGNVLATNGKDAVSFQIYSDCAYDWMCYRSGYMELLV